MTIFDCLLFVIVAGAVFYGYRRGIIAQIGSLVGVIAAIILSQVFAADIAQSFNSPGDTAQTRLLHTVLTYVLIFMACYIGARFIARMCSSLLSTLHLGGINNIAGAAFKVLEWVLFYSMFLNLWIMIMPQTDIRSSQSGLTRTVLNFAPTILGSETADEAIRSVEALKDKAREIAPADSTEHRSTKDDVRDAAIERVVGEATEHHSTKRR